MVLVSHIYKFIYLKNYKVAGTSVESFFGQFCINPDYKKNYSFKEDQHEEISEWGILGERTNFDLSKTIWYNHKTSWEIKRDLGNKLFFSYFKFCVVRNPYDLVVSCYIFFQKRKNLTCNFITFCRNKIFCNNITRILLFGVPICQYYIRYENLISDILIVLEKLGITEFDINDLPKHKTNINSHDKHYRDYYNDETKEIVQHHFKKEIEMFGYEF